VTRRTFFQQTRRNRAGGFGAALECPRKSVGGQNVRSSRTTGPFSSAIAAASVTLAPRPAPSSCGPQTVTTGLEAAAADGAVFENRARASNRGSGSAASRESADQLLNSALQKAAELRGDCVWSKERSEEAPPSVRGTRCDRNSTTGDAFRTSPRTPSSKSLQPAMYKANAKKTSSAAETLAWPTSRPLPTATARRIAALMSRRVVSGTLGGGFVLD
jgi:hypothetical protein